MNFVVLPPEINSLLVIDGPGSGPLLEAAAAWEGIGSELTSAASVFSSVTSDLAGVSWQGPASTSMSNAVVDVPSVISVKLREAAGRKQLSGVTIAR